MKTKIIAIFVILFVGITSCTPTKTFVDTSCPGYKSPEFQKNNLTEGGIGIMPVLGGSEKEQFRRPMGDAIYTALSNRFGRESVLSTKQVISILNDNNLTANYTTAIHDYNTTGIVPKDMVHQIQEVMGVKYLLYLKLLSDSEAAIVPTGKYTEVIKVDEIYVQCQVWDCSIGDVVWEGKGGVAVMPSEHKDLITLTADGLASIIGNEVNIGPCETKKELLDAISTAKMGTYLATFGVSFGVSFLLILLIL